MLPQLDTSLDNTPWDELGLSYDDMYGQMLAYIRDAMRQVGRDPREILPLKTHLEDFRAMCHQMTYRMPGSHFPFERFRERCMVETLGAHMIESGRVPVQRPTTQHLAASFFLWMRNHHPLVAPKKELLLALRNTTPPDDFQFGEIDWPYPFWVMALPRGLVTDPYGMDISYLIIRTTRAGTDFVGRDKLSEAAEQELMGGSPDEIPNMFGLTIISEGNAYYRSIQPKDGDSVSSFMEFPELKQSNLDDKDDVLIREMISLVFNIALYLMSHPDDNQPSELLRVTKGERIPGKKKRRPGTKIYQPNVLGRAYASQLEKHGTHGSPRTHWRRGHWRRVHHGEGRKQTKLSWIKATLVND